MTPNDQYNLIPQEDLNAPFEGNILEIPIKKTRKKYCFFILMFISIILNFLPTIVSIKNLGALLFIIIGNIVFICLENKKIVITKDESKNIIYIQLVNYFFIKKKILLLI